MSNGIIIYARMGSTRLPGKAIKKISTFGLLEHIVLRIKSLENEISALKIIIATTTEKKDDVIVDLAERLNVDIFRGHPVNLVERTLGIIKKFGLDSFCRVNGDCPFVDRGLILKGYDIFKTGKYSLVTNVYKRSYPYGVAVEWIDSQKYIDLKRFVNPEEEEHVTLHLYRQIEKKYIFNIMAEDYMGDMKLTVDTPDDLKRIKNYFDSNKNIDSLNLNFKNLI